MSDRAKPASTPGGMPSALQMGILAISGAAFGGALEKTRVFEPYNIRAQFDYSKFIMMKMFLAAVGLSCFSLAALSILAPRAFNRARKEFDTCCQRGLLYGGGIGGAMLGAGMAVAGACPGMVIAQVGAGVSTAPYTVAGCIAGALAYAAAEPTLRPHCGIAGSSSSSLSGTKMPAFLDHFPSLNHLPFAAIAGAFGAAMLGLVAVFEHFFPWESQIAGFNVPGCGVFDCYAWNPAMGGAVVGLLQFPVVLLLHDTIGSSGSYVWAASRALYVLPSAMGDRLAYLKPFVNGGVLTWWQVPYVMGAALGAAASAHASGSVAPPGVPSTAAFIGGSLMLFGARLAGGCTSGHGISGMGVLSPLAFVAVAAMFAGGTAAALFMRHGLGVYDV